MPRWLDPPRWPLIVAAVCLTLSVRGIGPFTRKMAEATGSDQQGCGSVPWLKVSRLNACRGIVLLELAGSKSEATRIVRRIRAGCACPAAMKSVKLDYFLILSYVALLGFFGATVAGLTELTFLRWTLLFVVFLQGVAGVLDGLEDIGLFAMLKDDYSWPKVAEWTWLISAVKWWLIFAGAVAPVFGLVVVAGWRFTHRKTAGPAASAGAEAV
jgi:hypothetical protein